MAPLTRVTRFALVAVIVAAAALGFMLIASASAALRLAPQRPAGPRSLLFELNDGQHPATVRYAARGAGYRFALLDDGLAVALKDSASTPLAFRMRAVGGRAVRPAGEAPATARVNYFRGRDARTWRTNVPTFARIRQHDVYPGIDFVYYGNEAQLEYDIEVAPHADLQRVRLQFDGAERIAIEHDGALRIDIANMPVRCSRPVAYQQIGGTRRQVRAAYRLVDGGVAFEVGDYDAGTTLVIDPVLVFSTYLGGTLHDMPHGMTVDAAGNTYVVGMAESTNFPVAGGAVQPAHHPSPGMDAFVTKLSRDGAIVYSTYLGGNTWDEASAVDVDAAGSAYVVGRTESSDFPATPGAFQTARRGDSDAFVTKLSPGGNRLVFSTLLGGSRGEHNRGDIAVDMRGFAYVAGTTLSDDFPTTANVVDPAGVSRNLAGFVAKLNQAGSGLVYGTYLTGVQQHVEAIALEENGQVVVTGSVSGTMRTTTGPAASLGTWDAFVIRLNATATTFWARRLGGNHEDFAYDVAIAGDGMVHVTGSTRSTDLPVLDHERHLAAGDTDAFVLRVSPTFLHIFDAAYIGGNALDTGRAIFAGDAGNVTLVGDTWSTNFPVARPLQSANAGRSDAFVMQYEFDNTMSPSFSTYFGGAREDFVADGTLDGAGAVTLVGQTTSTNLPVARAAQSANGNPNGVFFDGFVVRTAGAPRGVPGPGDVVVQVAGAASLHGNWFRVDDAGAAGGVRLHNPNAGAAKVTTAMANPSDFFEFTVNLEARTAYRMWVRAKADSNSTANDSVWVQFSNSSNGAYEEDTYEERYRIGTTNAIALTVEDCTNCLVRGWGWQDGGWGLNQLGQYFYVDSGATTVRVQRREDGISIDQIVFVPALAGPPYNSAAPGYQKDDTTIVSAAPPAGQDVVLYPGVDGAALHGAWQTVADATAAGGARVWHPNAGAAKITTPLANPAHYVDLDFDVTPGVGYQVWLRLRAQNDNWANDSVYVQFSGAFNEAHQPVFRIGSTQAGTTSLEQCTGCGVQGWGWEDLVFGPGVGGPISFDQARQRIRIQTREDGVSIDQIVLSTVRYRMSAPGANKNDATIVPR
jgi:hypothetical protein